MKRNKKILFLLIIVLFGVFVSYVLMKPSKEERYAQEYLKEFYNISDYELCSYLTSDSSAPSYDDNSVKSVNYFTDEGYDQFVSCQIYDFYEEYAYENKCTLAVKSIKTNQEKYDPDEGLWKFSFIAEIELHYNETEQIEMIEQHGMITILSDDDEKKIDSIVVANQNEIVK